MPVLAVYALGLRVGMDGQDFGMAVGAGRVGMDVQVAKVAAEPLLLIEVDPLVAEEQNLMFRQRGVKLLDLPVAERGSQVDVGDLGADDRGKRLHLDGVVGHH